MLLQNLHPILWSTDNNRTENNAKTFKHKILNFNKFNEIDTKFKIEIAVKLSEFQEFDRNARNKSITLTGFLSLFIRK